MEEILNLPLNIIETLKTPFKLTLNVLNPISQGLRTHTVFDHLIYVLSFLKGMFQNFEKVASADKNIDDSANF